MGKTGQIRHKTGPLDAYNGWHILFPAMKGKKSPGRLKLSDDIKKYDENMDEMSNETRLMGFLAGSEKIVIGMMRHVIERAGRENRVYLDEEEVYLERLEEALEHINKARFCVTQSGFKSEHEVNNNKK